MDGGEEGCGIFGVSCGNAAPALQVQEGIFHQMAEFIKVCVVFSLFDTVFLRRDNRIHALIFGLFKDGVCVIAAIGKQIIRAYAFNQAASLRTIRSCTLRDNDSDRHTMRLHGQMYFGVEPPFVRLMS